MREFILTDNVTLFHVPKSGKVCGVVLPTAKQLTKDGFGYAWQADTIFAAKYFNTKSIIGKYTKKWGARVFYLGTFQNPAGGTFRLFSFPVKYRYSDSSDLTIICQSCEELLETTKKYKVDLCLMPTIADDLGYQSFTMCVKPMLELLLDDSFVMIHRKVS